MKGISAAIVVLAAARLAAVPETAAVQFHWTKPTEGSVEEVAIVKVWHPAAYPADAFREKVGGEVMVRFTVDETGRVTAARGLDEPKVDPRLAAAAVAAVKTWQVEPLLEDNQPVAACMDVPITFDPKTGALPETPDAKPPYDCLPRPCEMVHAVPLDTPDGDFPEVMQQRLLPGTVVVRAVVSSEGRIQAPQVWAASNADFVQPALRVLERWKFKPALQGDLAVPEEVDAELSFQTTTTTPDEVLAANGIAMADGSALPVIVQIGAAPEPVWPFELLAAGTAGSATVAFDVRENGAVHHVSVYGASQREFGAALAAALESWTFGAEDKQGLAQMALRQKWDFTLPKDGTIARLIAALKAGEIGGAQGLDKKLQPLYRVTPHYPLMLKERETAPPAGHADIEFIIDRDGRARLPRIVSASQEEFGWAAATAVAQWVFVPPRRGGEPVDVKVRVPFEFSAPEN